MRVGVDARLLHYRQGGIAVYIYHVLKELAALDAQSAYFVLHSRKGEERFVFGPNFRRANLWTPSHHRLERWALSLELLRLRCDVLHSPDFIPPQWGARRHVVTVHDLNFLYYPQFLTPESRRYYNGQIAWAVRRADHILVDSEATKRDLIDRLDAPAEKITVHMLGVDAQFRPLPPDEVAQARRRLALPPAFLLFVGTFEPRKNIKGLLEAYRHLRDALPDAPPLVLAGRRGWLFEDALAAVDALRLSEHVRWLENPPFDVLPALYNAAELLVAPSFYEGFGLTPLEAMACGLPTVVARRSALPEVTGDAAVYIDPDDPEDIAGGMLHLLQDADLRGRLARQGLARARRFTWAQTAQTVLETYRKVAGLTT